MTFENSYRNRRVLVTGHTGFKGSWLSIWLERLGAGVAGYSLEPPTDPSNFDLCGLDRRMNSVIGDVRDAPAFRAAVAAAAPDIVFHLAAQPIVLDSYRDPYGTVETNVMGTAALLDAVRECPSVKAVVVITSDKCYENTGQERGYRETDPMGGRDPYSASKGMTELLVASYRASFFNGGVLLASVRAGNVIGGGDFAPHRLLPDCMRAFTAGDQVVIRRPGSVRPWQHVLEPLGGYLALGARLLDGDAACATGWNFGPDDGDALPARDVVARTAALWGGGALWEVREDPDAPHEQALLRLDCGKAARELGWKPAYSLDRALEETVFWYKAHADGADMYEVCRSQIETYEKAAGTA